MSFCFGLNHGTVTALLAIASTELGQSLGGMQSGVLYLAYTLSALLLAGPLVNFMGGKWSLTWGLLIYCAYTVSFLVALLDESIKWPVAISGSVVGGIAAGWIWTAQGVFFVNSARLYATAKGIEIEKANSLFGALFATFYVGLETLLKALSSGIQIWAGEMTVYISFSIFAVGSSLVVLFLVLDPPVITTAEEEQLLDPSKDSDAQKDEEKEDQTLAECLHPKTLLHKASLAGNLLLSDSRIGLLYPLNIAFGFIAAFMNEYVNGGPLKKAIGSSNIGLMAAVTPGVATLLSFPYAWIANRVGKLPLMVFGAINFATMAFVVMALSSDKLQDLGWGLIFLYIIGGSGRAVFESTLKATVADFFPQDKEAAFANILIASGGSSALAFIMFPLMSKMSKSVLSGAISIFAIVCLLGAFRVHEQKKKRQEEQLLSHNGV